MIHAVQIGSEDRRFVPACSGADFHNCIAFFALIGWEQGDLNTAFEIDHASFEFRNFIVGHCCDLNIARRRQLTVVIQLLAGRFEPAPFFEQICQACALAHDFLSALAIVEQTRIRNFAFESRETFAFELNKGI